MNNPKKFKNRAALTNPEGRFESFKYSSFDDGWIQEEEAQTPLETFFYPEAAKTIISRNDSPDLGFEQSINPYRGCEHGCIYCYARPSHAYLNLSAGIDFETKIFYKKNAAECLEKEFNKKNYCAKPIVLGANTDPYQPVEAKMQITRSLLEVFCAYKHPVIIITKNALVERDLDLLSSLAKENLVKIAVSITSLSTKLKHIMEPRTTAPQGRLKILKNLNEHHIPTRVMLAPIIPMINDVEIEKILEAANNAGTQYASYVFIRLPYEVKDLFRQWLFEHFPDRANHVMSLIQQTRGGKDYDAAFGTRMRGEGKFADLIAQRFKLACKRLQLNIQPEIPLALHLFKKKEQTSSQLSLLDLFPEAG